MDTAPSDGSDISRPPEPGTRIGEVALFYTETAQRALGPGWDLELVPLAGKNPGVGGLSWQSYASSQMSDLRDRLKGLGPALRRVDGWGALMNRHIAFDVDHPEAMGPDLTSLVIGGLFNETRPGRGHWLFRVPAGSRFGGRKDLINERYPAVGGASWGEIKGFNSQVRIWSPNDDGSHVRLVPAEIPPLPPELSLVLLEPTFYYGDPFTDAALDDWLDEHTGAAHPEWLAADIARLPNVDPDDVDGSKNRRLLRRVYHVGMNVAAGWYPGRRAYEELHEAWVGLCIAEGDYITDGGPADHERKYRGIWKRCIGKLTCDPKSIADIEVKRLAVGAVSWDPEHNESDRLLEELFNAMRKREGYSPRPTAELSSAEMLDLLSAIDPEQDIESEGGQVFDLQAKMAQRVARLEAAAAPGPAIREDDDGELVVETGDEEIRGSTLATPERVVVVDAEPGGPEPEPDLPATWEQYCESILEQKRDLVAVEMRSLAVREVAAAQRRLMSGVADIVAEDFDDLDTAAVLEPPPRLMLVNPEMGLLYEDAVTMVIGDKATGKSWLLAAEALVQMRLGRMVAWLDWEMSASRMRARLKALGATSADVRGRWRYLGMHGAEFRDARKALAGIPAGTLVVVDSVSAALGSGGSDEDKASEYGPWIAAVKGFRAEMAACVVLIDHTGHSNKTRARGSSAKGQQADVEFTVSVVDPWTRVAEGWASLACRKDRGGHLKLERPAYGAFFSPGLRGGLGSGSLDVLVRELSEWEVVFAERALLDERERAKVAKEAAVEAERRSERERALRALADGERHPKSEIAVEVSVTERVCERIVGELIAGGLAVKIGTSGPKAGVVITAAGLAALGESVSGESGEGFGV